MHDEQSHIRFPYDTVNSMLVFDAKAVIIPTEFLNKGEYFCLIVQSDMCASVDFHFRHKKASFTFSVLQPTDQTQGFLKEPVSGCMIR